MYIWRMSNSVVNSSSSNIIDSANSATAYISEFSRCLPSLIKMLANQSLFSAWPDARLSQCGTCPA